MTGSEILNRVFNKGGDSVDISLQDKHGVAIRLEADESLEIIVQDSLTSLTAFSVVAEGHVVD